VSQYQNKHSHLSWSSIIPYLLPPSITIHGILPLQFTCLTVFSTISLQVFFGLPDLASSTSYSIHFFTNHCLLFTAYAHNIVTCFTVVPKFCHLILVSLSTTDLELYLVAQRHASISPISSLLTEVPPHFPFLRASSHFHATLLCTQLLYNLPLTINDIYPYW